METKHGRQWTKTINTALGPMTLLMTQEGPKLMIEPGMKYAPSMEFGTVRPMRSFLRPASEAAKDNRRSC